VSEKLPIIKSSNSKTYTYTYYIYIMYFLYLKYWYCNIHIHHNYAHIETNKCTHQLDYRNLLDFAADNMRSSRRKPIYNLTSENYGFMSRTCRKTRNCAKCKRENTRFEPSEYRGHCVSVTMKSILTRIVSISMNPATMRH